MVLIVGGEKGGNTVRQWCHVFFSLHRIDTLLQNCAHEGYFWTLSFWKVLLISHWVSLVNSANEIPCKAILWFMSQIGIDIVEH